MTVETALHNETQSSTQDCAPLLRLENLCVTFANSEIPAVNGVSLSVYEQQTVAVVGESGCGKTVTALSVLRLLDERQAKLSGAVHWQGRNLLECTEKQMRRVRGGEIAMIFQEPMTSLNPVYTIGDQILEAVRLHRKVSAKQAAELTEQAMADVGIDQPGRRMRQYPHEFSGGMRQRAMIAMALVCEPKLLLADEPTTALDVTTQAKILELLQRLQRERGMAVLLITHDFGVVAQNADVVCVMYGGRVVEYASAKTLFNRPLHPYTQGLLRSMPALRNRAERLTTVQSWVRQSPMFHEGVLGRRELIPWWPDADTAKEIKAELGSQLHEVEPGHWIQCLHHEKLRGNTSVVPGLRDRRV